MEVRGGVGWLAAGLTCWLPDWLAGWQAGWVRGREAEPTRVRNGVLMSNLPGMLAGSEDFRASGRAERVSGEPGEQEREWGIGGDSLPSLGEWGKFFFFFFSGG